jgi:hypothetical protein
MKHRYVFRPVFRAIALSFFTILSAGASFATTSISGTSTAELITSGPKDGMWKYDITFQWASETPVYQITYDLGLAACPCVCLDVFDFDFPAGATPGNRGDCMSFLNGKFSCDGDYWVGLTTPVVDWWPYTSACRPVGSGEGTLTMYSDLRPKTVTDAEHLYLRSGPVFVKGKISGQVPSCLGCGGVAVEETTWGSIKSVYR